MNNNVTGYDENTGSPVVNNDPVKKSNNTFVKVLAIIGGVVVGIIVIAFVVFSLVSFSSNKLICKSDEGNITIMYNKKTIIGYKAVKMSYNMDEQKAIADEIGVDEYMKQFESWFKTNTTGTCSYKKK